MRRGTKEFPAFLEREEGNKVVYEGLTEHSIRTANVGLILFKDELDYLERRYNGVREAFVVAAILHDIGKMNEEVLNQIRLFEENKINKISFACHELLSAQVAIETLEGYKYASEVIYAVLKHHHAMRLIKDCLPRASKLRLLRTQELTNNSLNCKLCEDAAKIGELMKRDIRPKKDAILGTVYCLEYPALAFALAGFLSLADSVAAYLGRVILANSSLEQGFDSSGKSRKFVLRSLEERGWDLKKEVKEIVKKYFG